MVAVKASDVQCSKQCGGIKTSDVWPLTLTLLFLSYHVNHMYNDTFPVEEYTMESHPLVYVKRSGSVRIT